jgi:tetratricopeptide (TPR) repeat protein
MRALVLAVAMLGALPALACINVYGTDLRGKKVQTSDLVGDHFVSALLQPSLVEWQRTRNALAAKLHSATLEERNDYAAALMHTGQAAAAIPLLQKIEQEKPGLYATATNLGTAYELTGDNARALQWIREGIRRNPRSHGGSEWLHVLILQTKLNVARNPRWLDTHSILAMGFGSATIPNKPSSFPRGNNGQPLDADATKSSIREQMQERLQFVKPPEPIVGDILFDYANLLMRTDAIETARAVYELAVKYQAPRAPLAKRRIAHIKAMLD